MNDKTVPDSALAVTLGAATLSGLLAGLGVWIATPGQLRLLSYGLFAGASVVFVIILILVGVAVASPGPGSADEDGGRGPGNPTPPPGMVPDDDLVYLDAELLLLLEQA